MTCVSNGCVTASRMDGLILPPSLHGRTRRPPPTGWRHMRRSGAVRGPAASKTHLSRRCPSVEICSTHEVKVKSIQPHEACPLFVPDAHVDAVTHTRGKR